MRSTYQRVYRGTQMSPNANARGNGFPSTAIVSTTRFVAGSMRETVLDRTLGTNTVPSPAIAALSGPWPTGIVATTLRVEGSMRETVLSSEFETQTAVGDTAVECGPFPTRTVLTRFVFASMRKMRFPF